MTKDEQQAIEAEAARLISTARSHLILARGASREKRAASVFFATLAMSMEPVPVWDNPIITTMATDGKHLYYYPPFVNEITKGGNVPPLVGVLAHEAMHPAMNHHERRGDRDPTLFNIAGDLAINIPLREAGFTLPDGALFPGEGQFKKHPVDLHAEGHYALLPRDKFGGGGCGPRGPGGKGKGQGQDPGRCGGVIDGNPADHGRYAVAVARAAQAAKSIGTLPSEIERLVGDVLNPKANWRDLLWEFASVLTRSDYSWTHPNRRFVHRGLYLPSLRSMTLGELFVSVDSSGSIDDAMLAEFIAQLTAILELQPRKVTVVYHHTDVYKTQEFDAGEPLEIAKLKTGGTSHVDVFDKMAALDPPPVAMIALTDAYTQFPQQQPEIPVLWAVSGNPQPQVPWGQVVLLKD